MCPRHCRKRSDQSGSGQGRSMMKRRSVRAGAMVLVLAAAAVAVAAAAISRQASEHALRRCNWSRTCRCRGRATASTTRASIPPRGRLYIAHMNAGQLLVFDTRKRRVVKTIAAPGVHGVIAVPQIHRVYASATDARQLYTIDSRTGRVLNRAPAGEYPDGLVYDPVERRRLRLRRERRDRSGLRRCRPPHRHGSARRRSRQRPVRPQERQRFSPTFSRATTWRSIDPRSNRVVRRIALPGCDHPHGLNVDTPRRLAFVACDGNAKLLTLDLKTMKVVGSMHVGESPDVLAFDTSLRAAVCRRRVGCCRRRRRARAKTREAGSGETRAERAHRRGRPVDAPRLLPARARRQRTRQSCGS